MEVAPTQNRATLAKTTSIPSRRRMKPLDGSGYRLAAFLPQGGKHDFFFRMALAPSFDTIARVRFPMKYGYEGYISICMNQWVYIEKYG